jgi:hypothetical protein
MSMTSLPSKLPPIQSRSYSPTHAPGELPKDPPSRSGSLRSKADDAHLPKPISRSNSKGSGGIGRRSSEAADKLAALHPSPKFASSAAVDSGEGPSDPHIESGLAEVKLQMSEELKKADAQFTAALEAHMSKGGTPEEFARNMFEQGLKESSAHQTPPETSAHDETRASIQDETHASSQASIHDDTHAAASGDSKGLLAKMNDFRLRVGRNNDFQGTGAKISASVANVTARNTLSVFLPTFARQFISMGIEAGFEHFGTSDFTKAMLGLGFGALPAVTAHVAGAIRDEVEHYRRTPEQKAEVDMWTSRRSRALMAGTAIAATVWEHKSGAAADNASLHMAFTIYTAMRDLLVQSNIRLDNKNTTGQAPDWKHFLTMSVAYGLDQGLVSLGMSTLASPSGPAAAKGHLPGIEQAKNAAIRAGLNLLGEIGEDLLFQSIPAIRSLYNDPATAHALELGIHTEGPTRYLANATMGPWAVRTGILATTIALTGISGNGLPKLWDKTGATLSDGDKAKLQELTSDMIIAGVNGFLYEPFANSGANQPQPAARTAAPGDVESQLSAHDALHDDTAAVTTYAHPNVDMTDAASVRNRSRDDLALRERRTRPDDDA